MQARKCLLSEESRSRKAVKSYNIAEPICLLVYRWKLGRCRCMSWCKPGIFFFPFFSCTLLFHFIVIPPCVHIFWATAGSQSFILNCAIWNKVPGSVLTIHLKLGTHKCKVFVLIWAIRIAWCRFSWPWVSLLWVLGEDFRNQGYIFQLCILSWKSYLYAIKIFGLLC